jgi:hypothetical protein
MASGRDGRGSGCEAIQVVSQITSAGESRIGERPSASASKRRIASGRDGRGSGCAAIRAVKRRPCQPDVDTFGIGGRPRCDGAVLSP